MEIRADAAERGVGTDFFCGRFGECGDHEAVVKGAGRLELHLAEQLVVQVTEFQPADVGGQCEEAFEQGKQAVDQHRGEEGGADGSCNADAEDLGVAYWVRPKAGGDVEAPEQEAEAEGDRSDIQADLHQLRAFAHPVGEQHAGDAGDQAEDHVGERFALGGEKATDERDKNRRERTHRAAEQNAVQHWGEGEGDREKVEFAGDQAG